MNIEEAIAEMMRLYPGATRGDTATPEGGYYEAARDLQFHLCSCSRGNEDYGTWEFVAEGPRGGVHHVGIFTSTMIISCGPKGYHQNRRPICTA